MFRSWSRWLKWFGLAALLLWLWGERGRLLRNSTWRMVHLSGWKRFFNLTTLHGYIYSRWTNLYIRIGALHIAPRLNRRGKRWLANHYHGKVLTNDLARAVVKVDREIPLRDLEHILPYPIARNLMLQASPDIAAYECPCRHLRENPCQPTQVCMVVGQPFVDFVLEHHPTRSRRLSRQEALDLLEAEHKRGHIHTAWFKDAAAGRFYAICNCCKCCCGGIDAMTQLGIPMMVSSGYVAQIGGACTGCGLCVEACPFDALYIDEGRARIVWGQCMGCGVCVSRCQRQIIKLARDPRKGTPLDVEALADEAAAS
ncbi:MAG TPA: 4Fe-4S binding protein [Chloroflexi bacterium]|jgi:ferredoxin|nr:4Fe-4S binding protein [Chloroflexota bacterium]